MKNPIYIEYYSHEQTDCFKINLPWTDYKREKIVLCKVSESYEHAKQLAEKEILKHFAEVTQNPPKQEFINEEQEENFTRSEGQWDPEIEEMIKKQW